jgi:glycine/D-amino acid oxidase-like deaminating enzyme
MRIIVVGGGIIGSMCKRYYEAQGAECFLFDVKTPYAASKCSAGIYNSSFINKTIAPMAEEGLEVLSNFATITKKELGGKEFDYCPPERIIGGVEVLEERVQAVSNNKIMTKEGEFEADKVVLACGHVVDDLLKKSNYPPLHVTPKWGMVFHSKKVLSENIYKAWMPYKQIVGFEMDNELFYFANGTSINFFPEKKSSVKMVEKNKQRLYDQFFDFGFKEKHIVDVLEGCRPYLKSGDVDFVKSMDKDLLVLTGTAKNGTILAGYLAKKSYEMMKN